MAQGKQIIFVLSIILVLFIITCSRRVSFNVLSTIFDGVPDPNNNVALAESDSIAQSNQVDTTGILASTEVINDQVVFHEPFLEKECANCHDPNNMGSFLYPQPELCYQCHEKLAVKKEFSHGPAASGYCTSCHSPHKTETTKLLLQTGQELCLDCHNSTLTAKNEIHSNIGETSCSDCHDPHSSDSQYLLQPGICNTCHDDFGEIYSFLHGPVQGQYCATCHEGHTSDSEDLLARADRQLCLHCHAGGMINQVEKHKNTEEENCTACHNPHGGEDRYMLN